MSDKYLYLIDATALCYRAFYALPGLRTSSGQPTNAVYGFINILNKLLKEKKPAYLAACFDVSRNTFRQKKFAEYKIQRPAMPDELSSQIPLIKEVVSAYRIAIVQKEGFEADDLIATLVSLAAKLGLSTIIVSSDKDMLQLVDEHTFVFNPYKDNGIMYDTKKVMESFDVTPSQITDIIALMGDSADNIPGVPGIGEKTAINLIKNFGPLEKLLNNTALIKQEKIRSSVESHISQIKLSKELAVLVKDTSIDFSLEQLEVKGPDQAELFRIFKALEFKRLLKQVEPKQPYEADIDKKADSIDDKELKSAIGIENELFLDGFTLEEMVFSAQSKPFVVKPAGQNLMAVLDDQTVKKIGHDLKKTKVSLAGKSIILRGLHFDTMIAAYLLNPSKARYDLTELAWDYFGDSLPETLSRKNRVEQIVKLRPKLQEKLQEKSLLDLFTRLEMPLVEVLAEMEITGIKLDLEFLAEFSANIEKRLKKLIEDIYELSGCQFNINSPKQLQEVLFKELKLPVVKKNKTGPSTDEEVLKALADKHKLPALLLEYRHLSKIKNTYIDTLPVLADKNTNRIHTSFNQTGTETGRLSSSNPNLQNLPVKTDVGRNIRRAVISSGQEYLLLSCDYSQIELRILAHLSKDTNLIQAFKNGHDIHKASAALIYGIAEKDITGPMREAAKRVNFGIVYGLSAYGLSRDLGITVQEAQNFIDAYFLRYPKVSEYIQEQIKKAERDGFVTTILGRRRYIPEINNKNQAIKQFAQRQAINTPIQGSASDLIKLAMIEIHHKLIEDRLKTKMLLQVHDELVFDLFHKELQETISLIRDKMENVLSMDVPIKVEMKKGKNWAEMEEV